MILAALKEYYDRKSLEPESGIAPLGWEWKNLPFLFVLSKTGKLLYIEDTREDVKVDKKNIKQVKSYLVPQAVKRSSGTAANFLWDNAEYVTGYSENAKERAALRHQAFLERLEFAKKLPTVAPVLDFLRKLDLQELEKFPEWKELKKSNTLLSFKFAGHLEPVFREADVIALVEQMAAGEVPETAERCLVTGEKALIAESHPLIKGVAGCYAPGGSNIISFNLRSAESYGWKKGAIAPVGEKNAFAYTTALNTLLARGSSQKILLGNATVVFWAAKQDPLEQNFGFFTGFVRDNPDRLVNAVSSLLESVHTGSFVRSRKTNRFYVLGLTPNSARIAVSFWHCGTVADIEQCFCDYFEETAIVNPPYELEQLPLQILLNSIAAQGDPKNIPGNLAVDIMYSILSGTPYPAALLAEVLLRIRVEHAVSYPHAKLLKGYLNRLLRFNNSTKERNLEMSLDKENRNIGYCLGRFFAVCEKTQQEVLPNIKTTVNDRYIGSMSTRPSSVFATVFELNQRHLAKLEKPRRRTCFEQLIGEIMDKIQDVPATLSLLDQGRFGVGYYHQKQEFYKKNTEDETEQKGNKNV